MHPIYSAVVSTTGHDSIKMAIRDALDKGVKEAFAKMQPKAAKKR
jgi:hypothetical protein